MKLIQESITHNFSRGESDKLSTMSLGKKAFIIKWLNEYDITNYEINEDLTIDVYDDVRLMARQIKEFPEYINFNLVSGVFDISSNGIRNLRGCPKIIGEKFNAGYNFLKTLEGGPQQVGTDWGHNYDCNHNELISLKGAPEFVGHNFYCINNLLSSLEYAPYYIGGSFDARENDISLEEQRKFRKFNGVVRHIYF